MREEIRRRQRRFFALVLAVVIGFLPTVEVWAETYKIIYDSNNSTPKDYATLNNAHILGDTLPIYVKTGDIIQVTDVCTTAGMKINFYKNDGGTTSLGAPTSGTSYTCDWDGANKTVSAPSWDKFNSGDLPISIGGGSVPVANQGWKVNITRGSSGFSMINFYPVEVFNIKYIDTTTGAELIDSLNKNPRVIPRIGAPVGDAAVDTISYVLNAITQDSYTFNGFAGNQDNITSDNEITAIQSTWDTTTNSSIMLIARNHPTAGAGYTYGNTLNADVGNSSTFTVYVNRTYTGGTVTPTPGGGGTSDYEPDPYKITYYPDNVLNFPIEDETYDLEIGLPKNTFRANPGQMFEGWQVADTEQDPIVGTGEIYKPGTVFKVKDGMAFIAVWKDNPTFKIESDEEYILTPPENTINKLTSLIRLSSEITYYEDGEEPEEGDTEKEKKVYIKGTAIPSSQLEVVIDDPKAIRKVGTFPAKIVYKGLYNRTIEKTVSVTVLDPNAPTYDSFSITDVKKVGTVVIDYPSSIAYHGDKWDKAKSLVKVTDDTTKVIKKKVKSSDLTELKAGDNGKFKKITVKVKENKKIGINKKKSRKLTKKVNHRVKAAMKANQKTITIRPLIVMPELINNVSATGDKLKSVSLVLDDKTMVTIKKDSFTIDEEKQVVNFSGNYGGNLTFEELGLIVPSPTPVPVPSNVPTNK